MIITYHNNLRSEYIITWHVFSLYANEAASKSLVLQLGHVISSCPDNNNKAKAWEGPARFPKMLQHFWIRAQTGCMDKICFSFSRGSTYVWWRWIPFHGHMEGFPGATSTGLPAPGRHPCHWLPSVPLSGRGVEWQCVHYIPHMVPKNVKIRY